MNDKSKIIIKKSTLINAAIFLLFTVYFYLILSNIKVFEIWPQITDVMQNVDSIDIKSMFSSVEAHTLRLSLLFPVMYLAHYLNIDANNLFSWILYGLILSMFVNTNHVNKYYSKKKYNSLLIASLLLALTLFMNGRGIIGLFSMSLLLRFFHYATQNSVTIRRFFITSFIILYLSSVSSGIFFVSLCSIMLFFFFESIQYLPKTKRKDLKIVILIPAIIVSLLPFIGIYWEKNIDFYSGSITKMLDHGLGVFLKNHSVLFFLSLFIMVSPILASVFYSKIKKFTLFRITAGIILASVLVGLFGQLSMMMGLLPLLIIISQFLQKIHIHAKLPHRTMQGAYTDL